MSEFILRIGSCSDKGIRAVNEDRFIVDLRQRLLLVADGMGGQLHGDVASLMAVEILPPAVRDGLMAHQSAKHALRQALQQTNQAIVDASRFQPQGRRMGTTAVTALLHDGQVYLTHVGDSRAYLLRADGARQLTVDHSVAQLLVKQGLLTPQEARRSKHRHELYQYLGCADGLETIEVQFFTPEEGDWLLLGTDGLTNYLREEDLELGVKHWKDPQRWIDHLVQEALARGSRDNVTGVVGVFALAN